MYADFMWSLLLEAEKYNRSQWHPIPIIAGKQPPKNCSWADRRGTVASQPFLEEYFCNNQIVQRLAILLDSKKLGFALDIDGLNSLDIFQSKIISKYSLRVQEKINRTTHTKSANGGYHWMFEVMRSDFPKGIIQRTYWTSKTDNHEEIKVIGSNQYLIERGIGYEPIRGIESIVTLSRQEVDEILNGLDSFKKETKAVMSIGSTIVKYYYRSNRQNLALRVAGYLHKYQIPECFAYHLIEYLIDNTKDEETAKRFQAVRNTYAKDATTGKVSGRTKLLEAVNGDESVIVIIHQELAKLDYQFNGNGNRNGVITSRWHSDLTSNQNEEKKYEYIQKYSSDNQLAEAIIIGGRPYFAAVSSDGIKLVEGIPLDDSKKTVLRPLELASYINKPYAFKSKEEFENCIQRANKENLDTLYERVKGIWNKYIDADDFHISLCAADTIFTYYQDKMGMTHYLFFIGDNDSGKSNNLVVLNMLSYRNMMSVGMSVANVYQFLGSRDEGVGTICEDEADNIENDHEKMQIAKSGYTKGYPVTKIVITPFGRIQNKYNSFCFKAYAGAKDSTVAIGTIRKDDYERSNINPTSFWGTGFFVTSDGYFMTAAHVLEKAIQLKEATPKENNLVGVFYVSIVGSSLGLSFFPIVKAVRGISLPKIAGYQGPQDLDISICKVLTGEGFNFTHLLIQEPSIINLYDEVAVCGYPSGELSLSISRKTSVSGTRYSPIVQFGRIAGLLPVDLSPEPYGIQTDIVGTAGSSGSPIIDISTGGVIGLVQQVLLGEINGLPNKVKVGLMFGISNHILYGLPQKTKTFFETGKKIDINFGTTGLFEYYNDIDQQPNRVIHSSPANSL